MGSTSAYIIITIITFFFNDMNGEFCLIFQEDKPESLKCPLDSLQEGAGREAYQSFLNNVVEFRKLGALSVEWKLEEETSVEELCSKRAVWHISCCLKFTNSKLERVQNKLKRKRTLAKKS